MNFDQENVKVQNSRSDTFSLPLEIKKGDQASIAWLDVINKNKDKVAIDLEEYCKLDTMQCWQFTES